VTERGGLAVRKSFGNFGFNDYANEGIRSSTAGIIHAASGEGLGGGNLSEVNYAPFRFIKSCVNRQTIPEYCV
jgi:hypothetical protein